MKVFGWSTAKRSHLGIIHLSLESLGPMFESTQAIKFQHEAYSQLRRVRSMTPSFRPGNTIEIECSADLVYGDTRRVGSTDWLRCTIERTLNKVLHMN
jgi:hypothetical protein